MLMAPFLAPVDLEMASGRLGTEVFGRQNSPRGPQKAQRALMLCSMLQWVVARTSALSANGNHVDMVHKNDKKTHK